MSARCDFADGRNAAQQFVERLEIGAQFGMKLGEERRAQQFAGGIVVALLERAAEFRAVLRSPSPAARAMVSSVSVTLAMALTTTTGFCARRPLTMRGHAVDGLGVFDRSATELHDDHGRDFPTVQGAVERMPVDSRRIRRMRLMPDIP